MKLLDDMQTRMLSLYSAPPPETGNEIDKMRESIAGFCAAQVGGLIWLLLTIFHEQEACTLAQ